MKEILLYDTLTAAIDAMKKYRIKPSDTLLIELENGKYQILIEEKDKDKERDKKDKTT